MYFRPKVIYETPGEDRKNSILRYIGNRVLRNNKNFLCAITGQTGSGKSWAGLSMCYEYSKMFNIPFDVEKHTIHTLKQLLLLIKNKELEKNIQVGTPLLFEEPQVHYNSRQWQSEANQMLSVLLSTFRNQRLVVFFSTPFLSMIDKQSRILFHGEFKMLGFDKNTGIANIKPRFLEYSGDQDKFYYKKLIVEYSIEGKAYRGKEMVFKWELERAPKEITDAYEEIKRKFSVDLVNRLWKQIDEQEKQEQKDNKPNLFFQVQELYSKYGENYPKILTEVPSITAQSLEKYINLLKRSARAVEMPILLT